MLNKFISVLQKDFNNLKGKKLFLAISGGKDSMTLSHLLLLSGHSHILMHCNFQLRGRASDLDEEFIVEYAKKKKLELHLKRFDTNFWSKEWGISIQETARKLRYDWFNSLTQGENDVLLTAHHLDDSIETFFINLMRGTGLNGLTGINQKRNKIYRPLYAFTSMEIANYISKNNIDFRQDESNFDNKYLRNQIRNNLIPQFEEKSSDFKSKMANTIGSLKDVSTWIEKQVKHFTEMHFSHADNTTSVSKQLILDQDTVFITFLFARYGIHRSNVKNFLKMVKSTTGARFISDNAEFVLNRDEILIRAIKAIHYPDSFIIEEVPAQLKTKNYNLTFSTTKELQDFSKEGIFQFDFQAVSFPLIVRPWRKGDRIRPLGMRGSKLISDVLIDKKVSSFSKENVQVIESATGSIISIIGMMVSDDYAITSNTQKILLLELSKA